MAKEKSMEKLKKRSSQRKKKDGGKSAPTDRNSKAFSRLARKLDFGRNRRFNIHIHSVDIEMKRK